MIGRLIAVGREAGRVDTVGIGVPGLFDDAAGATTFLVNVEGTGPAASRGAGRRGAGRAGTADQRRPRLRPRRVDARRRPGLQHGVLRRRHRRWWRHRRRRCAARGPRGRAGELGHVTIDPDRPRCNCGNHGCVEAFVRDAVRAVIGSAGRYLGIGIANAIVTLARSRRRRRRRRQGGRGPAGTGPGEVARRVTVSVPVSIVRARLGVAGAIGAALRGAEVR